LLKLHHNYKHIFVVLGNILAIVTKINCARWWSETTSTVF